jgi:hypothetical protein
MSKNFMYITVYKSEAETVKEITPAIARRQAETPGITRLKCKSESSIELPYGGCLHDNAQLSAQK